MDVRQTINKIAQQKKINLNQLADENVNLKSLGIDSLAAMDLIVDIEDALNVRLSDEELVSIKTLGDLIKTFEKHV
ncbi:phosphopantetheine-binding protein [Ureaplasma miroungigenitalium]|uniref:Phosphopantetheine-binding protein n=1 Tax=Ureaplasma miroungigenitalium TaxID=1042321 RepID=A0ABT3BMR2_9BACT|nr:acyl carrier protein [Ureaplasma miroungigenitalium]MCV3728376.1 phosphopantetheine-binding protein [Ureaplasma miroungigenitalium]MCV3734163.1 phosphopantetheine-binding protein [Ureaplasma miroungigenitalium]